MGSGETSIKSNMDDKIRYFEFDIQGVDKISERNEL